MRQFAEAFVASISSVQAFTRDNMAPFFHHDVTWQAGVIRLEGIDVFIAANNQAWQTLGMPEVRDVEIDADDGFAVIGYTLAHDPRLANYGSGAHGQAERDVGVGGYPVPRRADQAHPDNDRHHRGPCASRRVPGKARRVIRPAVRHRRACLTTERRTGRSAP
jgi:hypothetical protein